jgi:hypothetical protein
MKKSSSVLFFILLLVVAAVFGWFGDELATQLFRQYESASFPSTTGHVYNSEVSVTKGTRGGTHYHVHIFYEYSVDDLTFHSWTYRFGPASLSAGQAEAVVAEHPAGSDIMVYYRPGNPADSLLSPGLIAGDFPIFFAVFSAAILMVFIAGSRLADQLRENSPAGGTKIIPQGSRTIARLPRYSPASWAVWTFFWVHMGHGVRCDSDGGIRQFHATGGCGACLDSNRDSRCVFVALDEAAGGCRRLGD